MTNEYESERMSNVTEYLRGHLLGEVSVYQDDRKAAGVDYGV